MSGIVGYEVSGVRCGAGAVGGGLDVAAYADVLQVVVTVEGRAVVCAAVVA
jgi:hypothetical protein